jgi:hypothetical protein
MTIWRNWVVKRTSPSPCGRVKSADFWQLAVICSWWWLGNTWLTRTVSCQRIGANPFDLFAVAAALLKMDLMPACLHAC